MTDKTTTEGAEVPHVYTALGEILAKLSVSKTGVLPSNMGGKSYVPATEINKEVKALFVAHHLILLPDERLEASENILVEGRAVKITTIVRGEYTIVSTEDGSSVTIAGVGDGLASNTAVSSNIASTNALKNALLRLFLITEQSAEDEAKNGAAEDRETPAKRQVDRAKSATASASSGGTFTKQSVVKAQIQSDFVNNPESPVTLDTVKRIQSEVIATDPSAKGDALFTEILKRLKAGEV